MTHYNVRFIDGPLVGKTEKLSVLFSKITKHPEGGGRAISYYRKDNPKDNLREYRYSVKP